MSDTKTDAIVPHARSVAAPRSFSLMPNTFGEAMEIAKMIADSDFAPKDYKGKPGAVVIAIQMGADVGFKPMQALQSIAVINGRPAVYGDGALALVQAPGILERFHETIDGEGDKRTATCIVKRRGMPDEVVRTFSVADAKRADLWQKKGPWTTYPDRMLQMRARGFALRDAASDVLMGLILVEEAMDYPDAIDAAVVPEPAGDPMERVPEAMRENVAKAFEAINLSPAQRLVRLNEFLGKPDTTPDDGTKAMLEWCRDEFAKQKTGQPRKQRSDNANKAGTTAPAATETKSEPAAVAEPPKTDAPLPAGGWPGQSPAAAETTAAEPVKAGEIPWGNQGQKKPADTKSPPPAAEFF